MVSAPTAAGSVSSSPVGEPSASGRPRGEQVSGRILAAARLLFTEQGYAAVTMAAIAAAAGVGLDTIYRRWPSKQALLVDLMARALGTDAAVPDTGDVERDLRELLTATLRTFSGDLGPLLAAAIAEAAREPGLAATLACAQALRRESSRTVITRAITRGQLMADVNTDLLLDLIAGLIWQRVYVAQQPVSQADIEDAIALLLAAHRPHR